MDASPSLDYTSFLGESSAPNDNRRGVDEKNSWFLSARRVMLRKRRMKGLIVIALAVLAVVTTALISLYFHSSSFSSSSSSSSSWPFDIQESVVTAGGRRGLKLFSLVAELKKLKKTAELPDNISLWKDEDFENEFLAFRVDHEKDYESEEEANWRFQIFKTNLYYIHLHNAQDFGYFLKMNRFGDLTPEEFKERHTGYRRSFNKTVKSLGVDLNLLSFNEDDLPVSVNWRQRGCVTEIKDQKKCGSCWAFSATGALEGAACAKTGKLVDLSEQQLVDCAAKEGNMGCRGGEMDGAFQYVMDNGGLCSEEEYPYDAKEEKCVAKNCTNIVTVRGFKDVPQDSESSLKAAVHLHGPVAVGIEADQVPFQFYHHGVFSGACGSKLDHGVLLVGYGVDEKTGREYWEVKNSWGNHWGENGYIRLSRNKGRDGECGILLTPSYPVIEDVNPTIFFQ